MKRLPGSTVAKAMPAVHWHWVPSHRACRIKWKYCYMVVRRGGTLHRTYTGCQNAWLWLCLLARKKCPTVLVDTNSLCLSRIPTVWQNLISCLTYLKCSLVWAQDLPYYRLSWLRYLILREHSWKWTLSGGRCSPLAESEVPMPRPSLQHFLLVRWGVFLFSLLHSVDPIPISLTFPLHCTGNLGISLWIVDSSRWVDT